MLIVIFLLFVISAILLIGNYSNVSSRWGALLIMSAGFGVLSVYFRDNKEVLSTLFGPFKNKLFILETLFSTICYYFSPYLFLIFGLYNNNTDVLKRIRRKVAVIAFIPVPTMYISFLAKNITLLKMQFLAMWTSFYIIGGAILLLNSYKYSKIHKQEKIQKLIYCIVFIPAMLFQLMVNEISPLFIKNEYWRYGIFLLLLQACLSIFFMAKYGFGGLKVKVEQQYSEQRINEINQGVNSLIHAIKNNVLISKYELENIISDASNDKTKVSETIIENLEGIKCKNDYLLNLTNEINKKINNQPINKKKCNAFEIVNETKMIIDGQIDPAKISLGVEFSGNDEVIYCDKSQLMESLLNIYKNSIEAMKNGGYIHTKCICDSKNLKLVITDNGEGISKENLDKVTYPFFSTKGQNNYGIGLSYCFNIIRQHKGNLSFMSELGKGTTVNIVFPMKYLKKAGG